MTNVKHQYPKLSDMQNLLIKERLAKANLAVNTLAAVNLTVMTVCIETTSPKIVIRYGRACDMLKSAMTLYRNQSGRRVEVKVAMVADCQVQWEVPA